MASYQPVSTDRDLDALEKFVTIGLIPKTRVYEMIQNAVTDARELNDENENLRYIIQKLVDAVLVDSGIDFTDCLNYLLANGHIRPLHIKSPSPAALITIKSVLQEMVGGN